MSRESLPARRGSETIEFEHGGSRCTATVSYFSTGSIAEIFLNQGKVSSGADIAARDSAVVASIALQYGVPVDVIRHALTRNPDGGAAGPLGVLLDLLADSPPQSTA